MGERAKKGYGSLEITYEIDSSTVEFLEKAGYTVKSSSMSTIISW